MQFDEPLVSKITWHLDLQTAVAKHLQSYLLLLYEFHQELSCICYHMRWQIILSRKKLFTLMTWKSFLDRNFLVSQDIGVVAEGLATNFTCEIIMLMWWFHMIWHFVAELCRTLYARNLEHQFLHNQETHSKYSTNLFLIWTAVVVKLLHLGESFSTLLTQGYRSFHGVVKLVRFWRI